MSKDVNYVGTVVNFNKLQSLLDWSYANDFRLDLSYGQVTVWCRDENDNNRFVVYSQYFNVYDAYKCIFKKD